MQYQDQLVPTGKLNDVGAYVRVNVEESYRLGAEISLSLNPVAKLTVDAHATVSDNRIRAFDEYIDDYFTGTQFSVRHENTHLAFSPSLLAGLSARYALLSNQKRELSVGLHNRYVGEQYVDNTSRDASLLDPYLVSDLVFRLTLYTRPFREITLAVFVNNILDTEYESNGWIYRFRASDEHSITQDIYAGSEGNSLYHLKGYFPQAGRNLMVQLSARF
jgi:iron complex outermembrane receptor protein